MRTKFSKYLLLLIFISGFVNWQVIMAQEESEVEPIVTTQAAPVTESSYESSQVEPVETTTYYEPTYTTTYQAPVYTTQATTTTTTTTSTSESTTKSTTTTTSEERFFSQNPTVISENERLYLVEGLKFTKRSEAERFAKGRMSQYQEWFESYEINPTGKTFQVRFLLRAEYVDVGVKVSSEGDYDLEGKTMQGERKADVRFPKQLIWLLIIAGFIALIAITGLIFVAIKARELE